MTVEIFTCPNCGGTTVAGPELVEWVRFAGASHQYHVTCGETVVALPLDYGLSMDDYAHV